MLSASPGRTATFHYDAFLSGLPVGTAIVEIELTGSAYRISGTAMTTGAAYVFSDWRSDFLASGRLHNGVPELTFYAYDEREKRKHRVLSLSEGMVRHVKNDRVRPSHPVLTGTDVLTAFFLQGDCWSNRQVHTGRSTYRLVGRPAKDADGCHLEVEDNDGDRNRAHVRFGTFDGWRIPIELKTKGLIRGRISLRPPADARGRSEDADLLLSDNPSRIL